MITSIRGALHRSDPWAAALLTAALASAACGQCGSLTLSNWRVVNATGSGISYCDSGAPIDERRVYPVATVVNGTGDLIYTIPSNYGTRVGRFDESSKTWQIWTNAGWSNSGSAVGDFMDHTFWTHSTLDIFPHPTIADGFLGVGTGTLHTGGSHLDHHLFRTQMEFTGTAFKQWTHNAEYKEYFARQVIPCHTSGGLAFAYNPADGTGLIVGVFDGAGPQGPSAMSAVRYDHDETGSLRMRRWTRTAQSDPGEWGTENINWPNNSRLTSIIEWEPIYNTLPTVAYMPSTGRYFATFWRNYSTHVVARYSDSPDPHWEWWDGDEWQPVSDAPTYSYGTFTSNAIVGQVFWNGKLVIFTQNEEGGISEILYDDSTETFGTEREIISEVVNFPTVLGNSKCYGVDADNNLYFAYTRDQENVRLAKRTATADWTEYAIFTDTVGNSIPAALSFTNGGCMPVLFMERRILGDIRLYAIAPNTSYWSTETPRVPPGVPSPVVLDAGDLEHDDMNRAYP